jgi:hypothetical protein
MKRSDEGNIYACIMNTGLSHLGIIKSKHHRNICIK